MPAETNGSRRFVVHCADAVLRHVERMHQRARLQGRHIEFSQALHRIIKRLEVEADSLGEPRAG